MIDALGKFDAARRIRGHVRIMRDGDQAVLERGLEFVGAASTAHERTRRVFAFELMPDDPDQALELISALERSVADNIGKRIDDELFKIPEGAPRGLLDDATVISTRRKPFESVGFAAGMRSG